MAEGVVDQLELVQIGEQDRGRAARALATAEGVVEPLEQQDAVGHAGQRIVQGAFAGLVRGLLEIGTGLGVEQVGRGDVGQGLGGDHGPFVQGPRGVPVQVQRPQPPVAVPQRKGEHGHEASIDRLRRERREPALGSEIGHRDGLARLVSREARSLVELGLESLEAQGCVVRGGNVVRAGPG